MTKVSCSDIFKTSTASIKEIKKFTLSEEDGKSLIVATFHGVKNPTETGFTPYFGISTHNKLGYIIDRKLDIK